MNGARMMESLLVGLGFVTLCAAIAVVRLTRNSMHRREAKQTAVAAPTHRFEFTAGDRVKIREGTFQSFEGSVETIDEATGKVNLVIEIYGRAFPIRLDHRQVESV